MPGKSVGTRWTFIEHERRRILAQLKALPKGVLGLPLLQDLIGDLGQVEFVVLLEMLGHQGVRKGRKDNLKPLTGEAIG